MFPGAIGLLFALMGCDPNDLTCGSSASIAVTTITAGALELERQPNECPVCGAKGVSIVLEVSEPEVIRIEAPKKGDAMPAGDGCNTCTFNGSYWGCTAMGCLETAQVKVHEVKPNAYRCPRDGIVWMP